MIGEPAEKPSQVKGFEVLKWDDGSKRINSLFHSNNSEILGAGDGHGEEDGRKRILSEAE